MLANYFLLACKNIINDKINSAISLLGLTIGFCVFLLSQLLVKYESDHDHMFDNRKVIYTIGSQFSKTSGESISEYPSTKTAYFPYLKNTLPELLAARSIQRSKVISVANKHQYHNVRFVDPEFSQIFNFDILHGSAQINSGLILTQSLALELFGETDIVGKQIIIDKLHSIVISGVIKNIAADSHFNSTFLPDSSLEIIAPISLLQVLGEANPDQDWISLPPATMTYVLLPANKNLQWLVQQVDTIYNKHTPDIYRDYVSALKVRPLVEANLQVWYSIGFPVLETISLLGFLVLVVSFVNYTNLTISQSFSRAKELGLRQTFGASTTSLLLQFVVENLVKTLMAALVALAIIEIIIPQFNQATGKVVQIDYFSAVSVSLLTAFSLSLLAAIYPILLVSKNNIIDSLHNRFIKSAQGKIFRQGMVTLQFSIAISILAVVTIIHYQNQTIEQLANNFPREEVAIVEISNNQLDEKNLEAFISQVQKLEDVSSVSRSSGIPLYKAGKTRLVSTDKPSTTEFKSFEVSIDDEFLDLFELDVIHGRKLSIVQDKKNNNEELINVVINQKLADVLLLGKEDEILGKTFYARVKEGNAKPLQYRVVGVTANQYYMGVHSKQQPIIYSVNNGVYDFLSIKLIDGVNPDSTKAIKQLWRKNFEQPIRLHSLTYYFELFYRIPIGISKILFAFSLIALSLALIGLYGLSAYMAKRRTKEIAIRKVMGADTKVLLRLLILDFSKPVFAALIIASPIAYFSSNIYLDFFPQRIAWVSPAILFACVVSVLCGWLTVAGHAFVIAQKKPASSLCCE